MKTMATADPVPEVTPAQEPAGGGLLVFLAPLPPEQFEAVLTNLSSAFPPQSFTIATPETLAADSYPGLQIVSAPAAKESLTLGAAGFINAHQLAEKHSARAILMLGPDCGSLQPAALRDLAQAVLVTSTDLAIPYYELPPNAGLMNSAILYPLSRALFASNARYPLAVDLGLSLRMAERLAVTAQRFVSLNMADALVWPVTEAAVAGCSIQELDVGVRALPQPVDPDVNAILAHVTGSLFADIDVKAAFWQRARRLAHPRFPRPYLKRPDPVADIGSMLEAFRLAYSNLQEIWSLVLPPNSLLGLKRLSVAEAAAFHMPERLWARIVYDFLLAYRLRTINRGHLLGALIPLYLAWVAGHINIMASGADPDRHIEAVAAAFEAEKPYLVSRWRWPDRFNP
jgi:glucosylglycerate synthase